MMMCDQPMTRLDLLPDEWSRVRECVECGAWYRECDQVGRLACRVHPGVLLFRDARPYFSCCGRENTSVGCLSIDHTTLRFARHPIERRLTEIQSFVTLTLPRVYLQRHYIVTPRDQTIVFTSPSNRSRQQTSVRLTFDALARAHVNHKSNLLHANEYSYVGDEELMDVVSPPSASFSPVIELPIDPLLDKLGQMAVKSRLLQYEMSQREARRHEIERDCDAVWRDFDADAKPVRRSPMPFVIIRRCGD